MEKFERTLRYINLFEIYKDLLTYTQKDILGDYFLADLSISEIANERNISRSAVEDAISKACKKLDDFEDKLHCLEKKDNIVKITAELKKKALNCAEIDEIETIEKELDYGIWKPDRKAFSYI